MTLLREIRRRNVFRAGAAYVIVAWLIIQVVETVLPPFGFGDAAIKNVIVALAILFVPFVVFAWAFELTPEGLKPDREVDFASPVFRRFEKKLDRVVMMLLALGLAYFAFDKFVLNTARDTDPAIAAEQQSDLSNASPTAGKSIAILPFVDLSPGGDQEYLGDGIAEQLLNELIRLDGLRVANRTSSFSYRDSRDDLRKIGQALGVSSVLEGSVRKSGDRIRIAANLVDVVDGYTLWSKTFESRLTDIFEIQDEIAVQVAGALGVNLGVGNVNSFMGAGTGDVEAYDAYLQAMKIPILEQPKERIRLLKRAVEQDPDYAAAWSALGHTTAATMWGSLPEEAPAILDEAIPYLLRAVELEPNSSYAYTLLATVNYARHDWIQSEQYYVKALEILPDGNALRHYGNMLMRSGRSTAARKYYGAAQIADRNPHKANWLWVNADIALGQYEDAREKSKQAYHAHRVITEYLIALNEGDPQTIRNAMKPLSSLSPSTDVLYLPILQDFDSSEKALATLRAVYADKAATWPSKYHDIALLSAYFGDPEFSLQVISVEAGFTLVRLGALWYPVMSEVRRLPAFKELVSDLNLVAYWRTFGWADHCRPLEDQTFECH
jgi:TolB-like protein/Tfp pilus assembly protein PilF